MAKFQKEIQIHAPVEKVFGFMRDPRNLPEIWPGMEEVRNVTEKAEGGYTFDWVYKMGGMHFNGGSDTLEYITNKRVITESTRGIQSRFVWEYEAQDGETMVSVEIEYEVPIPLIGKLAEEAIVKQNEQEADALLANLKYKMETDSANHK